MKNFKVCAIFITIATFAGNVQATSLQDCVKEWNARVEETRDQEVDPSDQAAILHAFYEKCSQHMSVSKKVFEVSTDVNLPIYSKGAIYDRFGGELISEDGIASGSDLLKHNFGKADETASEDEKAFLSAIKSFQDEYLELTTGATAEFRANNNDEEEKSAIRERLYRKAGSLEHSAQLVTAQFMFEDHNEPADTNSDADASSN